MSEPDWSVAGKHWVRRCYGCRHRHDLIGDAHSRCDLPRMPRISFDLYGIRMGWVAWPFNFDPTWLWFCDGFEAKE